MENKFKVGDKVKFICTRREVSGTLTIGKTYTVNRVDACDGSPFIVNDLGNVSSYMSYRFVLVPSLFNELEKAQALVGKRVKKLSTGEYFTPEYFGIGNKYTRNLVPDTFNDDGYVVYLENDDYIAPVNDLEEVTNVVELTDDYDAIIEGDTVKVGCQNIPIDKVKEILSLWENLS